MIKVTIELWPFGDERYRKTIAEAFIANDGTGTLDQGTYEAWIKLKHVNSMKFGRVKNYKRKTESVWKLLRMVIESCLKKDEKPDTELSKRLKDRLK